MYSNPVAAQQAIIDNANVNANVNATGEGSPNVQEETHNKVYVPAEEILEMIKPTQIRLRRWYLSLPNSMLDLSGDHPTGSFSLRVAYLAAEVTLHRFIIRVVSAGNEKDNKDSQITSIVRSSALERLEMAVETLRLLRPQHLLQFWHFASAYQLATVGLFASLMFVTSKTNEEGQKYKNLLAQYTGLLQVYSDNDVIGTALRILRCSIAGVPGLD